MPVEAPALHVIASNRVARHVLAFSPFVSGQGFFMLQTGTVFIDVILPSTRYEVTADLNSRHKVAWRILIISIRRFEEISSTQAIEAHST